MYQIAVLSKGRPISVWYKTLALLKKHGISKDIINIFVIETEYELYKKSIPEHLYGFITSGFDGKIQQTEFIQSLYPIGTNIVFIDDDLEQMDISLSGCDDLDSFIKLAFLDCEKHKSYIWGVYPIWNPHYRRKMIDMNLVKCSTDLRFLCGSFYGIVNRPADRDLELKITKITKSLKDDVERTIRYFIKDGIVLRYNLVATKQKFYADGGFGKRGDRDRLETLAIQLLSEFFGDSIGKVFIRNDGRYELALNKRYVKPQIE